MNKSHKKSSAIKMVAKNPKAYHDYTIEETLEVGLVLVGSEVKSLRQGKGSIKEAYAVEEEGALYLLNATILEYPWSVHTPHDPKRKRKLLLHKRQLKKLSQAIKKKGITLVPLSLYFNERGLAKLSLGLAVGKARHEKREAQKDREWKREKEKIFKTASAQKNST